MPIFSIGFVSGGRAAYVSECARMVEEWPIDAVWDRSRYMNCGCDESACIKLGYICAPQGDDLRVLVSVYDLDGDEYDLTGAQEIVFAVADDRLGTVRLVKTLSEDDIAISTNGYQFVVYLTEDDTILPVKRVNYYEVRVTNAEGDHKTVAAGNYTATRTIIKDIA